MNFSIWLGARVILRLLIVVRHSIAVVESPIRAVYVTTSEKKLKNVKNVKSVQK